MTRVAFADVVCVPNYEIELEALSGFIRAFVDVNAGLLLADIALKVSAARERINRSVGQHIRYSRERFNAEE